ncbi:MAG TPA: ABC transporter permease, partial [Ilumatobacteraceae bacterium]|nr:ABC transporter permease [Ilumatobacteraceae bacterium]
FVLFIMSFLAWAAAGGRFAFVGMLAQMVKFATPLVFGALAGILCEKSGVVNIAIEGMLLQGAFTSVLVGSLTAFWVGVVAAMVVGALFAWLLAWLAIRFKVDQVIVGFFLNFLILGLTSFLDGRVLSKNPHYNNVTTVRPWNVPLLERIPVIGAIFFRQTIYVYIAYIAVFFLAWAFAKTRWGLRTRAVGEHPKAADTLGVNVNRTRYRNVIMAGALAGFGGSWYIADIGKFRENMVGGRGFIALAVVIIGRWSPIGALAGATTFGFFIALQDKLGILKTGLPSEFVAMLPYIATIVVVAGVGGKSRAPKAAGQPYESQ